MQAIRKRINSRTVVNVTENLSGTVKIRSEIENGGGKLLEVVEPGVEVDAASMGSDRVGLRGPRRE